MPPLIQVAFTDAEATTTSAAPGPRPASSSPRNAPPSPAATPSFSTISGPVLDPKTCRVLSLWDLCPGLKNADWRQHLTVGEDVANTSDAGLRAHEGGRHPSPTEELPLGAHVLSVAAWPSPRVPRGSAALSPALMEMIQGGRGGVGGLMAVIFRGGGSVKQPSSGGAIEGRERKVNSCQSRHIVTGVAARNILSCKVMCCTVYSSLQSGEEKPRRSSGYHQRGGFVVLSGAFFHTSIPTESTSSLPCLQPPPHAPRSP